METPKLHIVLYCPQIPQNTGNIGRTCRVLGARLHLIKPYGFRIDEKSLKRSGMDYWNELDLAEHSNWESFLNSDKSPPLDRLWLLTTKSPKCIYEAEFKEGDGLLFGREDAGTPLFIHELLKDRSLKIPHQADDTRSLNLSVSVGIAAYEAARQTIFSKFLAPS